MSPLSLLGIIVGLFTTLTIYAETNERQSGSLSERTSSSAPADRPLPEAVNKDRALSTPATDRENVAPQELDVPSQSPSFRSISPGCIQGKKFSVLSDFESNALKAWYLKTPQSMTQLMAVKTGSGVFELSIPKIFNPRPLYKYSLYYTSFSQPNLTYSGLDIVFCSDDVRQELSPRREGELLILVPQDNLNDVLQKLGELRLAVAELSALMDAYKLITIRGSSDQWAKKHLEKLRRAFPALTIDFNDFYMPASKARLFAKNIMNWPEDKCHKAKPRKVKIGIIDGAVNRSHPALIDTELRTKEFISQKAMDTEHATVIAMILAGKETLHDTTGLLADAMLYSADVVESSEYGNVSSVSAIVRALHWLYQEKIRLVNLSLEGDKANLILKTALRYARNQGMLIFAAAGNQGKKKQPAYPAAFDEVFAVTAVDSEKRIYKYANHGKYIDFAAPGVDIWTRSDNHSGQYHSGTSYAVPHALAFAANLLDVNPSISPDLVYESLRQLSEDLGEEGNDEVFGWGLLQHPNKNCQ